MFGLLRSWKRKQITSKPVPREWLDILEKRVAFYRRLPEPLRKKFLEYVQIFISEKIFTGAGGLQITEEMRVVIAACAVRLILHLDIDYYNRLTEILVYPYVYRHPHEEDAILGEASDWGTVVLSWPAVLQGLADPRDGHETALHEFAHVLDRFADGEFDGTPKLRALADYRPWATVMSRHFLKLRENDPVERKVLDMYGSLNEAEFFAVATEAYFEKPETMKRLAPDLYAELQEFYGGDPAAEEQSV